MYFELQSSYLLALFWEIDSFVFVTALKLRLTAYCLTISPPKNQTLNVPSASSSIGHLNEHLGWFPETWVFFFHFFFCHLLTSPAQTSYGNYNCTVYGRDSTLPCKHKYIFSMQLSKRLSFLFNNFSWLKK